MKQLIKYCSAFFLALILASLAGCADRNTRDTTDRTSRTAGQYIDDATITTRVKAALFNEPNLSGFQINVETYEGNVQLSGFVESRDQITRAVEIAQRVDGVRSVKNNLQLR